MSTPELSRSGGWFEKAQLFGKSFMLPIASCRRPACCWGSAVRLSNPNTVEAYPFPRRWLAAKRFTVMASAGAIVFANLAVLFAVGVAVG